MEKRLLKIPEAAILLGISKSQMYLWIKQEKVEAIRLPTGRYRIPLEELERVLAEANPDRPKYFFHGGKL